MRYLSHTESDLEVIFKKLGIKSMDELYRSIPDELIFKGDLNLPEPMNEWELEGYIGEVANKNSVKKRVTGGGIYHHFVPYIIDYLTSRSEFLTSYTPYQPEISQGTLQALFEYQTYISQYLNMDYSNASMYDGATSFAEALLLSVRSTKKRKVLVSRAINPHYLQVLSTYCEAGDIEISFLNYNSEGKTDLNLPDLNDYASISIQSPNFFGVVEDQEKIRPLIGENKTLFISLFTEALSFGLLKPPGDYDPDIVCGEGQSLGLKQNFGGPCLGIFAFKEKFLRHVPGRVVGESVDSRGERAFCLTLATREQHIRREKATSNICSNQGLCVLSATIYLSLLGSIGLERVSRLNYNNSSYLKKRLAENGVEIAFTGTTFNEFVIRSNRKFPGIHLGEYYSELKDHYLLSVTELFTRDDIEEVVRLTGGENEL